ncbi:MAG: hypothetical protein M1818_003534 [Claussenomyces sp. TS43310]|nr:MAG: hypothetical protein M1818_003534 [Claussenomyces sp. TS43310]
MHPVPGDAAYRSRSRNSSFTDNVTTPLAASRQPPQMTFFLADEKSMEASLARSSSSQAGARGHPKRSNYGVQSLDSTISSLSSPEGDDLDSSVADARDAWKKALGKKNVIRGDDSQARSRSSSAKSSTNASCDSSPSDGQNTISDKISQPVTPLFPVSPMLGSTPASSMSRRGSETDFLIDDAASQAILSSGEEDTDLPETTDNGVTSQLVMPSLSMPRRRPFTEKGRGMGRLKVLIAGDSGIGKTSLIKAIVQICDDIVHVDPLSSTSPSASRTYQKGSRSKAKKGCRDLDSTSQITEIYASTRAYPHWWSEVDEGRVLRRRRSMGDTVLERNICFVDTPGYGNGTSNLETITAVVQYLESQLERGLGISNNDLIGILGGNGGHQVDAVFYVIHQKLKPIDIEYLRRLAPLTNIIPLVAQADTLSAEQVEETKSSIMKELKAAEIRPFTFGRSMQDVLSSQRPSLPYSVSALPGSDHETMDASLLMSPDYVQPLIPTELSMLVEQVFDSDTIAWLRHIAARKCVQWRRSASARPQSIPGSLSLSSTLPSASASQIITPPIGATSSYALARVADHMQREDRLAQMRLSDWASELQRSLYNERQRFEALARGERAVWLTERLNECVQEGSLVPTSQITKSHGSSKSGSLTKQGTYSRRANRGSSLDRHDPLGLVQLNAEMQRRTWAALQIVGSFGILGGVAIWLARSWNAESDNISWGLDWTRAMSDW